MGTAGASERRRAALRPTRPWNGILAKFLLLLTPVFLAFAIPGIGFIIHYELNVDEEALAARVGNSASRTAVAIGRHDAARNPTLARDLMGPLTADRAFLCAELVRAGSGRVIAAQPPHQGCKTLRSGHRLTLPVDEAGRLSLVVRFSSEELQSAEELRSLVLYSVLAIAFIIAILASFIGFRLIVTRPLRLLTASIRHSAETGERLPVAFDSRDELGVVVAAYNDMLAHEGKRERDLTAAYGKLQDSQNALARLNQGLERTVQDRTKALEAEKLRAETANHAKSQFLANMSHELRTPLNAIIGFSQIMDDEMFGPIGDPRYRAYISDIHLSGEHLFHLINDILDLSKIEAGHFELNDETIDFADIVGSALRIIAERAETAKLTIARDLAPDLAVIRGDKVKLKQIVVNLLSNAIKFTDPGGTVTVKAWTPERGGIVFQVSDTGIGIAPEDIATAMSRFGQIDGALSRRRAGTGLGLPLSKALAEAHGGSLELQSELGVGTTVTVCLPPEPTVGVTNGGAQVAVGQD
jgi:signal transduction histidine kinase